MVGLFSPKKTIFKGLGVGVFSLFSMYTDAEVIDDDLYFLPLDELLEVRIATRSQLSVQRAPAIVSTINVPDLMAMGYRSLSEILSFLPGVKVNESAFGNNPVQIRGLSDAFNQKVLFMVDGVPYWMSINGDIPLNGIPLASIVKIEVIRGPGSVLYGTNASAGVINVITRAGKKESTLGWSLGSQDRRKLALYVTPTFGDISVNFGIESFQGGEYSAEVRNANNLFDFSCFCSPADLDGTYQQYRHHDAMLMNIKVTDFEFSLQAHRSVSARLPDNTILTMGKREERGYLAAFHYSYETEIADFQFFMDWNRHYMELSAEQINVLFDLEGAGEISLKDNGEGNMRLRGGGRANFQLDESWSALVGVEFESRETEEYRYIRYDNPLLLENFGFSLQDDNSILLVAESSMEESAAYSQFTYDSGKWSGYIGARYVNNSEFGSRVNPSLSLVYMLASHHSIKFLYAQGYNSPTFRQTSGVDNLGNQRGVEVNPEVVHSLDFAYTYSLNGKLFVANLFQLESENLIIVGDGTFVNGGEVVRTGFELDFQYRKNSWNFLSALSFLHEGNDLNEDVEALFSSKYLVDLGIVKMWNRSTLGGGITYGSERAGVDSYTGLKLSHSYAIEGWRFQTGLDYSLSGAHFSPDVRGNTALIIEDKPEKVFEFKIEYGF